jgi:hypothetical protein
MNDFKKLISEELNTTTEYNNFINEIAKTQEDLSLVCFLGAGTSMAQGYKGWNGYVQDFIQYWKTHLGDLIDNTTYYSQVHAEDLSFLDWLDTKSNYDNKRKVDMVHHIIHNYCRPKNGNLADWNSKYKRHENDFEKYYFLEIAPLKQNNDIIDQILNLSGFFITSNYDDQIEKAYKRDFELEPRVLDDANELDESPLPDKSILHLHGKPDRPGVLLVSSSESYDQLYFNNYNLKGKLERQLKLQNSKVLLFIGSSLQEEEILNLFTFNSPRLTKFALMNYRREFTPEQANIVKEYYKDKKDITILWYGRDYNDLPHFFKEVRKDVDKKNYDNTVFVSPNTIVEDLRDKNYDTLDKHITRAINNKEDFDKCFENNLSSKSIGLLINNSKLYKMLSNGIKYDCFWREVKRNYNNLSRNTKNKVVEIIQKMPAVNGYYVIVDILYKYSKSLRSKERFDFLYKNSKKFLIKAPFPCMLSTNEERVIWLLVNLSLESNYFYSLSSFLDFEGNKNIKFKFSSKELNKLLVIMNKDSYVATANFKDILDDSRWSDIYKLLADERILYENKSFPRYFYKNKLVQRLLVNLALEEKWPSTLKQDKLIKEINFDDKLLGQEMNQFVSKYVKSEAEKRDNKYYIDGWRTFPVETVEDKPFFNVTPLDSNEKVRELIEKLENALDFKPTVYDQNILGQRENLKQVLNDDRTWNHLGKYNIQFLSEAIDNKKVFEGYLFEINKILIKGIQLGYVKQTLLEKYLKMLSKNLNIAFQINYSGVLDYLAEKGDQGQKKILYNFLFNDIKLSEIDFPLDTNKKWISVTDFINSNTYEYLKLVEVLIKNDDSWFVSDYKKKFLAEIEHLDDVRRQYLKGRYYNYFIDDSELSTEYAFIGFSHRFRIGKSSTYEIFKKPLIKLLNTNFNDRACIENVVRMLLYKLTPSEVNMSAPVQALSYKSALINFMLQVYFVNDLGTKTNISQWTNWAIKNIHGFPQDLIDLIVRYIDEPEKGFKLFKYLINNKEYLSEYSLTFPLINFRKEKKYNKNSFELINKIIIDLFEGHYLKIDFDLSMSLNAILSEMKKNNFNDLISNILEISKQFLPSDEWRKLKSKYSAK